MQNNILLKLREHKSLIKTDKDRFKKLITVPIHYFFNTIKIWTLCNYLQVLAKKSELWF